MAHIRMGYGSIMKIRVLLCTPEAYEAKDLKNKLHGNLSDKYYSLGYIVTYSSYS